MKLPKLITSVLILTLALSVTPLLAAEAEKETEAKGVVNINTATAEELALLPGIAEKKAQAIIDYREKEGEFKAPKDLTKVKGIGRKIFRKIKDQVVVEGETTLKPPPSKEEEKKEVEEVKEMEEVEKVEEEKEAKEVKEEKGEKAEETEKK